jgi:hypothetical protein
MLFHSRTFWLPKDAEHPGEYEDAFAVDEGRGRVAIADGVSSAIFSRQWADLLTRAVVESPPDLADGEAFQQWLRELRKQWALSIDVTSLKWNQRAKLETGAFSTLLWIEFDPVNEEGETGFRSFALGDCCLFHVRDGQVLATFPIEQVEEFGLDPLAVGSINKGRDHVLEFQFLEGACREGDLIVLCTDALALWASKQSLAERPVDWPACWHVSPREWAERIESVRRGGAMRYDDTTLVLLWIGAEAPEPEYLSRIEPPPETEAEAELLPYYESVTLDIAPQPAGEDDAAWISADWAESPETVEQHVAEVFGDGELVVLADAVTADATCELAAAAPTTEQIVAASEQVEESGESTLAQDD